MKFLLVAINAKYIHSNLGVYTLKAYAEQELECAGKREKAGFLPSAVCARTEYGHADMLNQEPKPKRNQELELERNQEVKPERNQKLELERNQKLKAELNQELKSKLNQEQKPEPGMEIEIGEYTINHRMELVLKDIYLRKPDAVGFSCYIWNIEYVKELLRDLHKVLPECRIWLGGPEVSYDAAKVLEREPYVDGIMRGEGEETFAMLLDACMGCRKEDEAERIFGGIAGLVYRGSQGQILTNPSRPVMDLNRIPFPYRDLSGFKHKIIYYESSRGCPFSCSYCLSSIDKSVRFRALELVKEELGFFLERRVLQVKFVDRTFNCKKSHAMEIWRYILEHDNGITNFHFEISADLLDDEELELLGQMRPGLVQLEIGVQTTNPETLLEIRRKTDLEKLAGAVAKINGFRNIHQHLDLIAGLPYEDYDSFQRSFNDVYAMRPDQLQLGFLKVLKGSCMEEMAQRYDMIYKGKPPYEVLSTKWLDYSGILKLKAVEEMVEVYYNSGQFSHTMALLEEEFPAPFDLYYALAEEYDARGLSEVSHSRLARYEILFEFISRLCAGKSAADPEKREGTMAGMGKFLEKYRDSLMYDLYLRENVKSRPFFAGDQSAYKNQIRDFFIEEAASPRYLTSYEGYDSKQMSKMAHVEVMGDGSFILFNYLDRDPLNYNAKTVKIDIMSTVKRGVAGNLE